MSSIVRRTPGKDAVTVMPLGYGLPGLPDHIKLHFHTGPVKCHLFVPTKSFSHIRICRHIILIGLDNYVHVIVDITVIWLETTNIKLFC